MNCLPGNREGSRVQRKKIEKAAGDCPNVFLASKRVRRKPTYFSQEKLTILCI